MWNRQLVKANGKARFQANYWKSVLVALIIAILSGGAAAGGSRQATHQKMDSLQQTVDGMSQSEIATFAVVFSGTLAVIVIISLVLSIFIFEPLLVGCRKFFFTNLYEKATVDKVGFSFKCGSYMNIVVTMLMTSIKIFLWTCLFIVPGIIKIYSYRMVPYIISENPRMNWSEAQAISRNMMNGNKWDAFVYDLSFIGWALLSGLTLGLVGVFWYAPYKASSDAVLYVAIKNAQ